MALNENSVTFASGQLKLEGRLAKPSGSEVSRAAVICHPHPLYGGSMDNNVVEAILEAFLKLGFATLRFNFRGVGQSQGEHSGGSGEIEDAKAAMRFILSQPGIAQEKSVMAGYSFGAAIAMSAGLEMPEVATIAAVAFPVAMRDFSSIDGVDKKIVLVVGDRDSYCPERAITDLADKIGSQLRVIKGGDHFFGGYEGEITRTLEEMIES
jgi:alpha/beta superfamily hydrolase